MLSSPGARLRNRWHEIESIRIMCKWRFSPDNLISSFTIFHISKCFFSAERRVMSMFLHQADRDFLSVNEKAVGSEHCPKAPTCEL